MATFVAIYSKQLFIVRCPTFLISKLVRSLVQLWIIYFEKCLAMKDFFILAPIKFICIDSFFKLLFIFFVYLFIYLFIYWDTHITWNNSCSYLRCLQHLLLTPLTILTHTSSIICNTIYTPTYSTNNTNTYTNYNIYNIVRLLARLTNLVLD